MTILFSGNRTFPQGPFESAVLPVSAGIKQAGVPLTVQVSMGAEQFPNGHTDITIFISLDGGVTYHSASMGVDMPHTFRGSPPHFWTLEYSLGNDDAPTHAKYATNSPAGFTTAVTVTAT